MKTRFSTLDIIAILPELKAKLCTGWRVNQIYDCDQRTYLFKLNKSIVKMKKDDDPVSVDEEVSNKMTFIIESGFRMHTTDFDWPKSHAPSGFSTKLRKHIRNKRIENISQIGVDRLVDFQFGSNQAANHLIVELYDRGNLVLTDHSYTIIAILRWVRPVDRQKQPQGTNVDPNDSENFKIGDTYSLQRSRKQEDLEALTEERLCEMLNSAKILLGNNQNYKKRNKLKQDNEAGTLDINLKDLLNPYVIYGSSLLEDRLLEHVFNNDPAVKKCVAKISIDSSGKLDQDQVKKCAKSIRVALNDADRVLKDVQDRQMSPGYLVQKVQEVGVPDKLEDKMKKRKKKPDNEDKENEASKTILTSFDFFPILSCAKRKIDQEGGGDNLTYQEFESFDKAVDVYYSNLESQKLDSKALSAEKEAMKKLDNLKISQEKRLSELAKTQKDDEEKARLIELNCDKVENALLIIRSMIANQVSWTDIWNTIREAQAMNDPIATLITQVKFDRNEFTMRLCDPYDDTEETENGQKNQKNSKKGGQRDSKYKSVDIDISLSAYANARRFFTKRRTAVIKEKRTIEVSKKAFKNVERQTKEKLKEVVVKVNITKARKRYWFENFFWFISSDGYLVVAGRDAEQNEMLVKRYMKNNDIYVHADLHGAATVVIKNESSGPVPPKTLTEAGNMAVCYSSAWDSKIAIPSWWVYPKQVSKSAPTGEYLSVGAFMIRGKKNYLPVSNLVLGFGFLFRLGEESIERRMKERVAKEQAMRDSSRHNSESQDGQGTASPEVSDDESLEEGSDSDDSEEGNKPQQPGLIGDAKQVEIKLGDKDGEDDVEGVDGEEDLLDDEEEEEIKIAEHRLIDTLTESPTVDDVLLYAIAMCGPYSALQNFKYKVKVIPGSNKRGKAAKSCLSMFMHDKRALAREKDLLRAVKDQDYARNIPNKVKVSAPKMNAIVKRRPKKSEVRLPM